MIQKISRGWQVGGLIRYLMGPGRFNEHSEQRVIATWDGAPELHQPPRRADGAFDVTALVDDLNDPAVAAGIAASPPPARGEGRVPRGPVWHCSLRNHASDRVLSDQEWAQVMAELLDRTGIAPAGDLGACRWVAVRHAPDHVHVAAVLVRQDNGRRVWPRNDYVRAREVCRAAETRLGLTATGAADRTAPGAASRAELERALRRGVGEPSRVWLRRAARVAAVQAQDPQSFVARLGELGVLVAPRENAAGELVGYSVAAAGDVNGQGAPVWFGGRSLARDLALPKLVARWASAPPAAAPIPPAAGEHSRVGRAEVAAAVAEAGAAIEQARAVLAASGPGDAREGAAPGDEGAVGDAALGEQDRGERAQSVVAAGAADGIVHAAADLATAMCVITGGERAAGTAAELFDRAARCAGVGQPTRWAPAAAALRTAAWRLIAVRGLTGRRGDAAGTGELMVALAALLAEIAAYHEQRRRLVQAGAARAAATRLHSDAGAAPAGRGDARGPGRAAAPGPARPAPAPAPVAGRAPVPGRPRVGPPRPGSRVDRRRGRGR